MKVRNVTHWDTTQLRAIFSKCLAEIRKTEKHWSLSKMGIQVKNHRRPWIGGCAWPNSNCIVMKIPKELPPFFHGGFDFSQKIADVFVHEIGHCILGRDRRHRNGDTIESAYRDWILATFGNGKFPVGEQESMRQKKTDIASARYGRVVINLAKAATRLKRAKTLYDKWNRKKKYYEKKMAAKGGGK